MRQLLSLRTIAKTTSQRTGNLGSAKGWLYHCDAI
jgi:hypothetical protein